VKINNNIFAMVKYLSFHNYSSSSFALRYFLMKMARPHNLTHTPCFFPLLLCVCSFEVFQAFLKKKKKKKKGLAKSSHLILHTSGWPEF
jgi:hypothetical protein